MIEPDNAYRSRLPMHGLLAFALLALMTPAVLVGVRGITDSMVGSVAGCVGVVSILLWLMWRWLPIRFEGRGVTMLFAVWFVLCGAAAYRLGSLAIFMNDVSRKDRAVDLFIREFDDDRLNETDDEHSCFTAYMIAAQLAAERANNIYDSNRYDSSDEVAPPTVVHEQIGDAVTIDEYVYPPPFLLLPRLLMLLGNDFWAYRSIWFGLEVAAFVFVIVAFASWMSDGRFGGAWFALPALLLAPNMLDTLQIGNVHFLIVCLVMGGMLALEKRRFALGGLLLGFAIVGKVFPGVFVIYLVSRRRWRALLYTVGAIVLYAAATVGVFGMPPFEAFLGYQLPRLMNGQAFAGGLELYIVKVINTSVTGFPHRLSLLGLIGDADPSVIATYMTSAFSILLLIVLLVAGHRHYRLDAVSVTSGLTDNLSAVLAPAWLALVILAQLRSPLLGDTYGNLAAIWLVSMLAANTWRWRSLWLLPVWGLLANPVLLPIGPPEPTMDLYLSLAVQLVVFAIALTTALRSSAKPSRLDSNTA